MTGHHSVEDKRIGDDATVKRVLALEPKLIVESFKVGIEAENVGSS